VATELTQRDLRNDSGDVMRRLDAGEEFIVTRNGVPVAELTPIRRRRFVDREYLQKLFAHIPAEDVAAFHADIDRLIDQDPTPRA
jgi:prevent-host-death family protein